MTFPKATRVLYVLLALGVAVSVVHNTDNYFNYDDYPLATDLPNPSQAVVGLAWFVFTAAGIAGVVLWHRRRITAAAVALTGYSVSGLVGFAHYAAPGATDMEWWRQAHIVADILCGLAIFGFAIWAARNATALSADPQPVA